MATPAAWRQLGLDPPVAAPNVASEALGLFDDAGD
jgi:hypothetical protein